MSARKTILLSILLALAGWGLLNLDYWWQDVVGPVKDGPTKVQAALVHKVANSQIAAATDAVVKPLADLVVVGIKNIDLKKIPLGLDQVTGLDDDNDGLPNKIETALGTNYLNNDTDGDGIFDGAEVKIWQNPLGAGKWPYSITLINKLKGKLLLQSEGRGELWYASPVNGRRYYMESLAQAKSFAASVASQVSTETLMLEPNTLVIESLDIQVPVIYVTEKTDQAFQQALENGVVHYPDTANPGEYGNDYIFGHSSDYRWRSGNYKRIFATLPKLALGAFIYISDSQGQVFKYKVFDRKVVPTNATEYLGQYDYKRRLLTLQTSYPVNTALSRLVVRAELQVD